MKKILLFSKKKGESELIINGGFDTDTDWVKGGGGGSSWVISGGVATRISSLDWGLSQVVADAVNGDTYRLSIDVTAFTSGTIRVALGTGGAVRYIANQTGTFVNDWIWDGTNGTSIVFQSNFVGSIDNISLVKV